jgi:site-specific DNA recombinase
MRLVLAARLSQLTRGNETGIDTQDEDARDWALRTGHTIVGVAADDISGTVSPFKRKSLGPWLTDPNRMAMYDGILVTKIDRLTRAHDWGIREWAEQHGKKILVVSPELIWPPALADTTTPIQWDLLVNSAVTEWINTSQRYKRMLKSKRDQGFFTGKRPYGYRIIAVPGGKALEIDPVTGPIVRGMFKRYRVDGWSLRQIADWLTSSAVPVSQQGARKHQNTWSAQTVKNILSNPAGAGRIQANGRTVYRAEPLVSMDHFLKVQEIMAARAHHGAPNETTALLTSILTCPNDHPMYRLRAHATKAGPGRFYYYCRECPRGNRPFVWCDDIDAAVHDAVMAHEGEPHIVITVEPGDTYADDINRIKKEIAALDPEDDDWMTRAAALKEKIAQLRLKSRKPAKVVPSLDGKTVGEVWESLNIADKRQWLLARRKSNWLPQDQSRDQVGAKVQILGPRDAETRIYPADIDLGEFSESFEALWRL